MGSSKVASGAQERPKISSDGLPAKSCRGEKPGRSVSWSVGQSISQCNADSVRHGRRTVCVSKMRCSAKGLRLSGSVAILFAGILVESGDWKTERGACLRRGLCNARTADVWIRKKQRSGLMTAGSVAGSLIGFEEVACEDSGGGLFSSGYKFYSSGLLSSMIRPRRLRSASVRF